MSISKKDYADMTKNASPASPLAWNCLKAFLCGGAICALSEALTALFGALGQSEEHAHTLTLLCVIALTAILTACGVFDKLAKLAGAGTAVPITGFANSVAAPALESKPEGFILGTGAQMFSIAGPVLVFGCSSAALYGLIHWLIQLAR